MSKKKIIDDYSTRQSRLADGEIALQKSRDWQKRMQEVVKAARGASLGERIRLLREATGMSQIEFAAYYAEFGVNIWDLRAHEQGRAKDPRWSSIQIYAKIFSLRTDDFWNLDGSR